MVSLDAVPGPNARAASNMAGDWGTERVVEIALCLAAILFLAPLLILIGVCVMLEDGGGPIFGHTRIGRYGRRFQCLKFRTMVPDADRRLAALLARDPAARAEWKRDHKLRDDPRITRLGAFLRTLSLDELPQLFNVLRGEMSLVGPRPIIEAEVIRYGRYFREYCSARPGVTGLWQVSGRNNLSYRRRVAMDVLYVREHCLALYFSILLATVPAVLLRRGAH